MGFCFFVCFSCGILGPQPGIEPGPMAVKVPNLNHWVARKLPEGTVWTI